MNSDLLMHFSFRNVRNSSSAGIGVKPSVRTRVYRTHVSIIAVITDRERSLEKCVETGDDFSMHGLSTSFERYSSPLPCSLKMVMVTTLQRTVQYSVAVQCTSSNIRVDDEI